MNHCRWALLTLATVLLSVLAAVDANAHTGFGMVVDREGRVVFLDSGRSKVWRIEKDGSLVEIASGMHGNTLSQDSHGNLYFQNFNQTTWRLAPDGSLTRVKMPARTADAGAFGSLDEVLAVDDDGNLYVSSGNDFYQQSPQLLKITPAGDVVAIAGGAPGHVDGTGATARFSQIRSAAWGPDGALYVADGNSIRRVTLDGRVTTLAGGRLPGQRELAGALEAGRWRPDRDGTFHRIFGIAVDFEGAVYAADSDNFRIVRIQRDGSVETIRRTRLPWKPAGVAAANGEVYVLELMFAPGPGPVRELFTTHRVVRLSADGRSKTLATVGGGGGYWIGGVFGTGLLGVWLFTRRRRRKAAALRPAAIQA